MPSPSEHSERSELKHILSEENSSIRAFVALLKEEQGLLTSGLNDDIEKLPALTERKDRLSVELNTIAMNRGSKLLALGLTADRSGIDTWLQSHAANTTLGALWENTLALASEARELNRQNGDLIAIRMQHNSRALDVLKGTGLGLDLYGPDGQAAALGQRRINDAV